MSDPCRTCSTLARPLTQQPLRWIEVATRKLLMAARSPTCGAASCRPGGFALWSISWSRASARQHHGPTSAIPSAWQLCDANGAMQPDELTAELGRSGG
jgi:hypothetical protein